MSGMSLTPLDPPPDSPEEREPQRRKPRLVRWLYDHSAPTIRYWFGLDSHVYAMAISSNVLFGFFPFMLLILSISENLLGWSGAERAIYVGLRGFLPKDPGLVDFVERNLRVAVESRGHGVEIVSVILLIFASNGIFMPLEVAMNRLWGFESHRSYWKNQAISFCMTFATGTLALTAALWASTQIETIEWALQGWVTAPDMLTLILLKLAEVPFTIVIMLLIYWLLPNGPVPIRRALPTAIVVGVLMQLAQAVYVWVWPSLNLRQEYGPFFISVTLVLWGFFAAMLVLAGGEYCARGRLEAPKPR